MNKKKNLAIFSLNGTILMPDEKLMKDVDVITEEFICKSFFKTSDTDDLKFTKIDTSSYDDLKYLEENLRIYYSGAEDEIWNYNPIISAYIGELVYSPVIVFVAENEMNEMKKTSMDNEIFINIVSGFINICNMHLQKVAQEEINKKAESKKSPLFKLSNIRFFAAECPEYTEGSHVDFGKDGKLLDDIWKQYYTGKYFPDFIFDCIGKNAGVDDLYSTYLLMKPSLMTIYTPASGDISIYMSQYTREELGKRVKELVKIDSSLSQEEISEEKEKIMKSIYS